jgi:branched-chain amino acid transport system permease protein
VTSRGGIGLLLGLAAAIPLVGGQGYLTHVAITILIFSMLASSLNLLMGYTGLVSIAHGAFFGIGAYTSGILATRYGVPFLLTLPTAALVAAVGGLGIGLPSFRTRGIYYIIVTVAFQLIATEIFENWSVMTGGSLGLRGISRPRPVRFLPGLDVTAVSGYYYLVLAGTVLVHAAIFRSVRSSFGLSLMAIRDNETKALMMGLNPLAYKTFVFVAASGMAGFAGALYAHYLQFAHPEFFDFAVSVDVFLAVVLGGAGTLWGPPLGVALLEILREALHEFLALRLLIFGLLLVGLIVFVPDGLVGRLGRFTAAQGRRRPPDGMPAA